MTLAYGIDPSTKTGLVGLDEQGRVLEAQEIQLVNGMYSTPSEIWAYSQKIVDMVPKRSLVAIEGFSFGSKGKGVSTQYGVGYALRFGLKNAGLTVIEATPSQVKKFATGKGNSAKDAMILPINRHWGFEHDSDNVRDAFVLAQIALSKLTGTTKAKYQQEVLEAILEGPKASKKKA